MAQAQKIGEIDGQPVVEISLECGPHRVSILNLGCTVRSWQFDLGVGLRDLVLGFDQWQHYLEFPVYFGAIAGRVANRIRNGEFLLDGVRYQLTTNDGAHHLHGGSRGLSHRLWHADTDSSNNSVLLRYRSPAGEEGYPGNVDFSVIYRLTETGLKVAMEGLPDRPTPINLAQHNYYNLDGQGDVLSHHLWINAERFLPVDSELIPTGAAEKTLHTSLDFTTERRVSQLEGDADEFDHNLILESGRDPGKAAARLQSSDQRLTLSLFTDQPGLQLYNAAQLMLPVRGLRGEALDPFSGICLEAQHFPDSVNNADYPSIIYSPDRVYRQQLDLQVDLTR